MTDEDEETKFYFRYPDKKTIRSLSSKVVNSGISMFLKEAFEKENDTTPEKPFDLPRGQTWELDIIFRYLEHYTNTPELKAPETPADHTKSIEATLGDETALFREMVDAKRSTKDNITTTSEVLLIGEFFAMDQFLDKLGYIIAKYIQGCEVDIVKKNLEFAKKAMAKNEVLSKNIEKKTK